MKLSRIAPHPVLTEDLAKQLKFSCAVRFSSAGPAPGVRGEWGGHYTLGHDSDWNAHLHDLEVRCEISAISGAASLFGPQGIAPRTATLAMALEWLSPDSGWRILGEPYLLRMPCASGTSEPVALFLNFPPDSLRGTGMLSLQLLLHDPGEPAAEESALARTPGFRFGMLGEAARVIIDGDGSLFPVVEESVGTEAPLWQFAKDWSDPLEDEFSTVWLSLILNKDHSDFPLLRGTVAGGWTPLFSQVVISWVTTLILELKADMDADFADIESGRIGKAQRGSIAHAASSMVSHGLLDCSSPASLAHTVQLWVNTAMRQPQEEQ